MIAITSFIPAPLLPFPSRPVMWRRKSRLGPGQGVRTVPTVQSVDIITKNIRTPPSRRPHSGYLITNSHCLNCSRSALQGRDPLGQGSNTCWVRSPPHADEPIGQGARQNRGGHCQRRHGGRHMAVAWRRPDSRWRSSIVRIRRRLSTVHDGAPRPCPSTLAAGARPVEPHGAMPSHPRSNLGWASLLFLHYDHRESAATRWAHRPGTASSAACCCNGFMTLPNLRNNSVSGLTPHGGGGAGVARARRWAARSKPVF